MRQNNIDTIRASFGHEMTPDVIIDIGDGWLSLCRAFFLKVPRDLDIKVSAMVRDHGGLMKIEYTPADPRVDSLINSVHSASSHICEECGREGTTQLLSDGARVLCYNDVIDIIQEAIK